MKPRWGVLWHSILLTSCMHELLRCMYEPSSSCAGVQESPEGSWGCSWDSNSIVELELLYWRAQWGSSETVSFLDRLLLINRVSMHLKRRSIQHVPLALFLYGCRGWVIQVTFGERSMTPAVSHGALAVKTASQPPMHLNQSIDCWNGKWKTMH